VTVRRRDGAIIGPLRTLYNIGIIGDLTDGQLLERFATDTGEGAELAFAALVERHEAMVWRVCLAILRNEHEAQDAFQATFLVLVRKARSLWVRDSLGPWLHQVAWRTASYLRTSVLRRRKQEGRCAEREAARCCEPETAVDLDRDAAVHEEVNRLPEKYRAPVVLCDLQGRTHQEAARCLGWPIGTVKSRQAQGRKLIRDRLVRRGLGVAGAGVVVESSTPTTAAATPKQVARSTASAAMQQSARLGPGIATSAHVLVLTQGVLRAMLWIRVRFVAVASLAVAIAFSGAGIYVCGSQEPAPKEAQRVTKIPRTTSAQTPGPENSKKTVLPEIDTPRAKLLAQQLAARKARAYADIARATRELAEIALAEYEAVRYPRELITVEDEIKLAELELRRAEDRTDWAKRMWEKGYVSETGKASEEISLQKAKFSLEQVMAKKVVLVTYTRDKTIKELRSEVEKARADELAKLGIWEIEKVRELELTPEQKLEAK